VAHHQSTYKPAKLTVLLTGGSGFIGGPICNALQKRSTYNVRVLARDPNRLLGHETVKGELNDLSSLRHATAGISAVIHSASYIGYNPELCQRINVDGTRNLIQAAQENGVTTIIYVSTSAVYGNGFHRGIKENEISPTPTSILSQSRLEAENLILTAGGTVVRPYLVHGKGDQWAIPGCLQTITAMEAFIDNGDAKLSTIKVDHLGLLIATLVEHSPTQLSGEIFHVNDRNPVCIRDILTECTQKLNISLPSDSISFAKGAEKIKNTNVSKNQLALMWLDHWYDSSKIHDITGVNYAEGFHLDNKAIDWYSKLLLR
jgi:nucleoside-diphosphate-sugar epimerase